MLLSGSWRIASWLSVLDLRAICVTLSAVQIVSLAVRLAVCVRYWLFVLMSVRILYCSSCCPYAVRLAVRVRSVLFVLLFVVCLLSETC